MREDRAAQERLEERGKVEEEKRIARGKEERAEKEATVAQVQTHSTGTPPSARANMAVSSSSSLAKPMPLHLSFVA